MIRIAPLELGPPVGWPLKFRVSGPDASKTRELALAFAQVVGDNQSTRNVNYDWNEPMKAIKVEVDQDRAACSASARSSWRTTSMLCCREPPSRSCATPPT